MEIPRDASAIRQEKENILSGQAHRPGKIWSAVLLGLSLVALGLSGCGTAATPVTPPAANPVDSYFGGPFSVAGSSLGKSSATLDHAANQIGVSAFITTQTALVPAPIINGTFTVADTGFLSITENFATNTSGVIGPMNPPLAGAWAIEIPGAGALANLLSLNAASGGLSVSAAPAAMAENAACPEFSSSSPFLYVTVPRTALTNDTADYGRVDITTQGSALTLTTQPFLIGPMAQTATTVVAGCSITNLGALTAYPINSFGTASNLDLVSIGASGLLVSSFTSINAGGTGALGDATGVLGVAEPTAAVDVNAVIAAKYNGFVYSPLNTVHQNYDITVLASAFGNHGATSQECSTLQSSLAANHGQGAGTVPVLPSGNSIYGGEFRSTAAGATVNDPSGASGSENCDVAIDLGTEDSTNKGLFPNATVFIGSNFPPFSAANLWNCSDTGTTCAVSFPAAAVVGKVQGQYVIFVSASAGSIPAARLPDSFGSRQAQPVGIYLFQRTQ